MIAVCSGGWGEKSTGCCPVAEAGACPVASCLAGLRRRHRRHHHHHHRHLRRRSNVEWDHRCPSPSALTRSLNRDEPCASAPYLKTPLLDLHLGTTSSS